MSAETNHSYYQRRMDQLGITEDINQVMLWHSKKNEPGEELVPVKIFRPHEKGMEIIVYTLQRLAVRIEKEGSKQKRNWSIIRLEHPVKKADKSEMKYIMPKGQGSHPFFPPSLLDKYDNSITIDSLFLTEGFIKAFKGSMCGIDVVGLASITHLRNKETGALHPDILALINRCNIKRVVWLTDGDCLDLSSRKLEDIEDLYTRPNSFYSSVCTFKQLLTDYHPDLYFMHIDCDAIVGSDLFAISNHPNEKKERPTREQVKGLDDLLITYADRVPEIVHDLYAVSHPGTWFHKINITSSTSKVRYHFHLDSPTNFYLFHSQRRTELKGREFVFHGTRYRYEEKDGECKVLVPGAAKDYIRVGDQYYKSIFVPNKYGQLERRLVGRQKGTINDDHGKNVFKHIAKFENFCNVPDHVNFQQYMYNCYNMYAPLDFAPDEEACTTDDCPFIFNYIKHVFGENLVRFTHPITKLKGEYKNYELALDYIQLLYKSPAEKLPILCLVSKENNTGKSTFGKLLKLIFGGNCAIVGNADLSGDFNSHWASRLIVICDETKIDKQHVVEKVKSLSTADKIIMNAKGKDHVEIDCFIKFIFITNNEDSFISVSDEDIRYWVIKVPVITQENPGLMEIMAEEIPAFLSFLNTRKLQTEKLNRMWFYPPLLKTEALRKVQEYSQPQVAKEIKSKLRDLFFETGAPEILMTRIAIKEDLLGKRVEDFYIDKILSENLKVDQYHKWEYEGQNYSTLEVAIAAVKRDPTKVITDDFQAISLIKKKYISHRHIYYKYGIVTNSEKNTQERKLLSVSSNGRPYVFRREAFLTDEEIRNNIPDPEINAMEPALPTQGTLTSDDPSDLPF